MLLLVSTSDKIQVVTGQAVTTDVHASYMDYDSSNTTPGRKNTAITGATTTDVVAAPGSGVSRNLRTLTIRNKHASSNVDITVQHTDGTTTVELHKATLTAGQMLQFIDDVGFFIVSSPALGTQYARVTGADATTTGQALVDATGLTIPLLANRVYSFWARLSCLTTAVTTGTKYGVQFSAAGATVEADLIGCVTITSMTMERINALNTANATACLITASMSGPVYIDGQITVGANAGNLTIQHLKVTSGTSTIRLGSWLKADLIG